MVPLSPVMRGRKTASCEVLGSTRRGERATRLPNHSAEPAVETLLKVSRAEELHGLIARASAMRTIPDAAPPRLPAGRLVEAIGRDGSMRADNDSDVANAVRPIESSQPVTIRPKRRSPPLDLPQGISAPTAGLEPATRRLTEPQIATQSERLRHDESQVAYEDLAVDSRCFTVRRDDSSGNVRRSCAECMGPPPSCRTAASPEVPATSDGAQRLAVKLAVDAGEYERAAVVLDELRRTTTRAESS